MPRSQLLKSTPSDRERLRWLREFFDWLYAERRPAGELALHFWALWSKLHGQELTPRPRLAWQRLISNAPATAFKEIQRHVREWVEHLPGLLEMEETIRVKGEDQLFGAWPESDGRKYLGFGRHLRPPADTGDLMHDVGLDLMHQLQGLSVEVLGRCARCGRVFLRLRAKRRKYCSARCKYEAAPSTQRQRAKRGAEVRRSDAARGAGR